MSDVAIYQVDRVELNVVPWSWPFAVERRRDIDAYFAQLQRRNPAVWNGRVLLMHRFLFEQGTLSTEFFSRLTTRAYWPASNGARLAKV